MPTDLLLPAFALTLLANAVLVAVAIRALRGRADREDDDRIREQIRREAATPRSVVEPPVVNEEPAVRDEPQPFEARGQSRPIEAPPIGAAPIEAPPIGAPPADPPPAEASPGKPDPRPRGTRPRSGKPAASRGSSAGATTTKPATGGPPATPGPKTPGKRRARPDADASSADARAPRGATLRGGRRRFSLPPLDDDHDRVIRSIETFFQGGEAAETADNEASAALATTVAVVAIDGLAPTSRQEREAFDAAVATVERTLRGAARTADRVTTTGRGRFRIVLPATGELAARAYLRRVRATVEPGLGAADIPLGLVTATATVLDEAAGVAITQAEARLDTALASASRKPGRRPKAASD
jgi:GGDEF domain-containing protein